MAGDRRATSGNLISHRTIEKVFPADRHSRCRHRRRRRARPWRWCKLFQLQLEHYEKVEGAPLSLEGKANQLVADGAQQPARRHAGPGRRAALRRLRPAPRHRAALPVRRHRRPLRGVRLRRHRLGQPARRHGHQARLPRRPRPRRGRRPGAARRCSRPPTRTPPPAGPTWSGASTRWSPPSPTGGFERVADDELRDRFRRPARAARRQPSRWRCRHEHAVLRRPRAGDEGPGRLRPQGHRPGPQRWWPCAYADGILICRREPVATRCARSARSTTASPSPGSASTTSSTSSASPASATPTSRATRYSREDVDARSLANQYAQILGQIFTHEMKPMEVEILVAEVGHERRRRPAVPHPLRRHRDGRGPASRVLGGEAEAIARPPAARRGPRAWTLRRRARPPPSAPWPGPTARSPADDLEVAVLDRSDGRRAFRRIEDDEVAAPPRRPACRRGRRRRPPAEAPTPADGRRRPRTEPDRPG